MKHPQNSEAMGGQPTNAGRRIGRTKPNSSVCDVDGVKVTQFVDGLMLLFFFRPAPSWLSPGRSTSFCLSEINCENHATPSLRRAAKESGCGLMLLFFRPTPSWLSPGRSTSFYLSEINCENHAMPLLRRAAKESRCGPLHSPYSCPSAMKHTKKESKQRTQTQKHKQAKKHTTKWMA